MNPDADARSYPLTDLSLARRLERAEGTANAGFVEARSRLEPELGATWLDVAGAYAMFDGVDSPLTQTFGLGLFDPVGDAELEQIEAFFAKRGAPVFHEVSPLAAPESLGRLHGRGYRPLEFSSVLVRPTHVGPASSAAPLRVREVQESEADLWARIAAEGWSSESAGIAEFVEKFGQVTIRARGTHCFVAEMEGRPIAAAALCLNGDVALLAGASTIPTARRQGAQLALLTARLRFAAAHGAELAMVVAHPGSPSQRNAERQGFRTAYTRLKWRLDHGGRHPGSE